MTEQTLATETATDAGSDNTQNQAQDRVYSQKEVDDMLARMKGSLTKKLLKPYEELGDPESLRSIKEQYEHKQVEDQKKRGEFDNILKDLASKKDAEIQKRDAIIAQYKVEVPLLDSAARLRSVNPEQVKSLLRSQVRVNAEGDTEVTDASGKPLYKDSGEPFAVNDLVADFLAKNPHFVQSGPATTTTRNGMGTEGQRQIDISSLDMRKAEDRALYAEHRNKKAR